MSNVDKDTLHIQLKVLNERTRWYTSQLWQLPFAYFGVTGVVIASMNKTDNPKYALYCIAAAILGFFVLLHTQAVKRLEMIAIDKLRNIESLLNIPKAECTERDTNPMITATLVGMLFYAALGCFFLLRNI